MSGESAGSFGEAARLGVLDQLPELVLVVDADARVRWVNRTLTDVLGHQLDDVRGRSAFDFVHPDDVAYMVWSRENRMAHPGETGLAVQVRARSADGAWQPMEVLGLSLLDDPAVASLVITMRVLDGKAALADSPARLRSMIDRTTDVVLLLDADGRVVFANRRLTSLYGHDNDRIVGQPFSAILVPEARAGADRWVAALAAAGDGATDKLHVEIEDPAGVRHDLELRGTNQLADPLIEGLIVSGRDVSEVVALAGRLAEQNRLLADAASHDRLTGLCNRPAFVEALEAAIEARRDDTDDVVVLFCDLDGFKEVNDRYGHAIGDSTLVVVAQRLRDAVADEHLVARYGGDEFTVLLGARTSPAEVDEVVARIIGTTSAALVIEGRDIDVGVSVGVARTPAASADADALLQAADRAMYERKRGRGDRRGRTDRGGVAV